MPCRFCGKVIRVDMYCHVARLHLDLVQLWRCPIAWCTTWKGSPHDCLEHLRNGHDAPWISKTASIEKYAPPWTVRRQLWTDSLRGAFWYLHGHIAVQRGRVVINTALPSVQRRFTSCSFPHRLHRQTPVSSSVIRTVGVATRNRTDVDAKICETTSPIVTTEATVLGGGGR